MFKNTFVLGAVALGMLATSAGASEHESLIQDEVARIQEWLGESIVIESVITQNSKNAALAQADIDRLDGQWRSETGSADQPMIGAVLGTALSEFLAQVKAESEGMYTEIFVMDNRGLNVGQSDVTSDYWQGDEAKWQKTYLAGPGAVFIDDVGHDESTQTFQAQVSIAIEDPATRTVIGAVTIGIDIEQLVN